MKLALVGPTGAGKRTIGDIFSPLANLAALERVAVWGCGPDVFVLNKRDCPGAVAAEVLASDLVIGARPTFEGIATQKVGVVDAVKAALRLALTR